MSFCARPMPCLSTAGRFVLVSAEFLNGSGLCCWCPLAWWRLKTSWGNNKPPCLLWPPLLRVRSWCLFSKQCVLGRAHLVKFLPSKVQALCCRPYHPVRTPIYYPFIFLSRRPPFFKKQINGTEQKQFDMQRTICRNTESALDATMSGPLICSFMYSLWRVLLWLSTF